MTGPEENLRVVRSAIEAYLRGDEATMLALASPDVVATQFPDQLDVGDHRGRAELQRMMTEWVGSWEDWTIEPKSFDAAGERVFVNAVQRGRGRESGAPMESEVTFVFTVRDGLIVRWQMFHTDQEAREAAGGGR